jgi:long-chain fatty acid transport protein
MRRALALVVLALPAAARANPVDAFGLGSRASAMGGAVTAVSADAAANYYNPAGLARNGRLELEVGYLYADPRMSWNNRGAGVDTTQGTEFALVLPGHIAGVPLALGIGLFLPDERVLRIKSEVSTAPRFIYYDNRTQRTYMSGNIAARILPGLYVGGGVSVLANANGNVQLTGRVGVVDPEDSDLRLQLKYDLDMAEYPQFGVQYQPQAPGWDRFAFGLTYRHSFSLKLDQLVHVQADFGASGSPPAVQGAVVAVDARVNDLFQPAQLAWGASFRPAPRWLTTLDVVWAHWSPFVNPGVHIVLTHDLKSLEGVVNLPPQAPIGPAHFHDVVAVRVGAEHAFAPGPRLTWTWRGGYAFEQSPVPDQTLDSNFADANKHTFSTGVGLVISNVPLLTQPLGFDAHLAWTWLPTRETRKASPLDVVGDYAAEGSVVAAGATMKVTF